MEKLPAPAIFELLSNGSCLGFRAEELGRYLEEGLLDLDAHCDAQPLVDETGYSLVHVLAATARLQVSEAVTQGRRALLDRLIDLGAPLNLPARNKANAPLHVAAVWSNSWAAHRLLDAGVPVNLQNSAGETVLHLSVVVGAIDLFKELVVRGGDPEILSLSGEMAFDCGNKKVGLQLRDWYSSFLASKSISDSMGIDGVVSERLPASPPRTGLSL